MGNQPVVGDMSERMGTEQAVRLLEGVQPLYMLPGDPFAEEVLIPGFKGAKKVDCMVGFFSSKVLVSIAPGLATYVSGSKNSFRLIISPLLSAEDKAAIEDGISSEECVAERILEELIVTEDLLQSHTLKCLSWLLQERKIEIKVALMKDALFHPKVWLFETDSHIVAAHGSSNATDAGIRKNIEQIAVAKSWKNLDQHSTTDKLRDTFKGLWENNHDNCIIIDIPEAIRQRLLQSYNSESPPTESELRKLYDRAEEFSEEFAPSHQASGHLDHFVIPDWLEYEKGPFEHQGKAVRAWRDVGYCGVLEMATGSGKTITSMIGAHQLYQENKPLFIVIAAPYVPLIEQWCNETAKFGLNPINLAMVGNAKKRGRKLQELRRRLRLGLSDVEAVVVSHDTLCTSKFLSDVKAFECVRLLIADEVHNLGRSAFIDDPPRFFDYRLGLSATPVRQYDETGTEALFGFFGPVVFRFELEEAIGHCLVEYDYYIHPVYLTQSEMDKWFDLTDKIKLNAWRNEDGQPDNYLAMLMRDRRALLETASGKLTTLSNLLMREDTNNLQHALIYSSDKGPDQLKNVNRLLRDRKIPFHQLTAEETADRNRTKKIIDSFQKGQIRVLTAKRVLDEGINIPQICKAFILASTTVERQWVQRRGRLLRTCSEIGKTHSVIHDLVTLPPEMEKGPDPDTRTLVHSELNRVQEFARLARNAGRPDGPLATIERMVDAAFL